MDKLIISPAPHIHGGDTVSKNMTAVIIALIPALLVGFYFFIQLIELLLDPLVDARVGVAEDVHPPGADGVDVALAVEVLQPHPLAPPDRDQR